MRKITGEDTKLPPQITRLSPFEGPDGSSQAALTPDQAPTDGEDYSTFHFHIEIHPPLRTPQMRKYLAGCEEGGGNFLSDSSPEERAAELRAQSDEHYRAEK